MPNTFEGGRLPTFPGTWYHPIYGAREIQSYDEYLKLDHNWRATAAEADRDRTETEARVVMNHNDQLKREMYLREAEKLELQQPTKEGEPREGEEDEGGIARNSVQADEARKRGEPQPL